MAWQTPKTDWQAGDVPGASDFNRAEGNSEYLKTQTDGLKSGSIKAAKAGYADSAGQVKSGSIGLTSWGTGSEAVITHNFDTYNILVSVAASGYPGVWEFAGSNSIRITSTHPGSQTSNPTRIYRYTIFKP